MERRSVVRQSFARQLRKAVDAHCRETGDTNEDLAEALGISPSYFANILHCHRETGCPVDILIRLVRLIEDTTLIETVVEAARPKDSSGPSSLRDVLRSCTKAITTADNAVTRVLSAAEDGRITPDELEEIEGLIPIALARLNDLGEAAKRFKASNGRASSLADAEHM